MTRKEALKIAKPVLFNTDMVWAIQDGTYERMDNGNFQLKVEPYESIYDYEIKPKYQVGDILYVRETWQYIDFAGDENGYVYKASENGKDWEENTENWTWKPSIHFPKCADVNLKLWKSFVKQCERGESNGQEKYTLARKNNA